MTFTLDDEELINALSRSKATTLATNNRIDEAEKTTMEINTIREGYRVVAARGSIIFFVVASLALVDPMYQFSLQAFKELVIQRLKKAEKKDLLADRLNVLVNDLTKSLFTNICRGLFEKDKLLYSFMVAAKISLSAEIVSESDWLCFIIGTVPASTIGENCPLPDALKLLGVAEKHWTSAVMLEHSLPVAFNGLINHMMTPENGPEWARFFTSDSPHTEKLPGDWEQSLRSFDRLLLVRITREEKVVFAIKKYIIDTLGEFFIEDLLFDLERSYEDSTAVTPLIFILSSGSDPIETILQLAEKKGQSGKGLKIISLGQGQGIIAERIIEQAHLSGDWVCLQNCHLAVSWLDKLEQIVEKMQSEPGTVNSNHRLWLTSMPSCHFPVPILQNGIKMTNEPPSGIKSNLMRTFQSITEEEYENCSKKEIFKKLLFTTAFFNALILERRKFGAVGWNIPYDWMNSDLKTAVTQVRMYLDQQDLVPWETLNVSVGDIAYGGRVTDIIDKRTITTILRKYFTPSLLEDSFTFTEDGIYYAPLPSSLHAVREYIRQLPSDDCPDVFGLHPNAAISFQQKESKSFIAAGEECSSYLST